MLWDEWSGEGVGMRAVEEGLGRLGGWVGEEVEMRTGMRQWQWGEVRMKWGGG